MNGRTVASARIGISSPPIVGRSATVEGERICVRAPAMPHQSVLPTRRPHGEEESSTIVYQKAKIQVARRKSCVTRGGGGSDRRLIFKRTDQGAHLPIMIITSIPRPGTIAIMAASTGERARSQHPRKATRPIASAVVPLHDP